MMLFKAAAMNPEHLHKELLAVAEQIVEASRIAEEAARKRDSLIARHRDLVSSALQGGAPVDLLPDLSDKRPRTTRILEILASGAPFHHVEIANRLGDEPKNVYTALMDLKRRYEYVSGPADGLWAITPAGLASITARGNGGIL